MEFRKQDLLHEIDVVWLSSLESSKLYASCMQCNAIFKSVIVLYFFLYYLGNTGSYFVYFVARGSRFEFGAVTLNGRFTL